MLSNRFQSFKASLAETYQRTSTWISNKLNSQPALLVRGAVSGAVKAAYGVHYVVDAGLTLIPYTSPWYKGIKVLKYTATSLTFVVSSTTAYSKRKLDVTTRELVNDLENKLAIVHKMLVEAEKIIVQQDELLKKAGFGFQLGIEPEKISAEKFETKPSENYKSKLSRMTESKPFQCASSTWEGILKASGVHYIFKVADSFLPTSKTSFIIDAIASTVTFAGSTFYSYDKSQTDVLIKEKMRELELQIIMAHKKLQALEKILGDNKNLLKIVKYGSEVTHQKVWFEVELEEVKAKQEAWQVKFCKFMNAKPAQYIRSATDGSVNAAAVHNLFETFFPNLVTLRYLAAMPTLVIGAYSSAKSRQKENVFQEKLKGLEAETEEKTELLGIAKKILEQEIQYVRETLMASGRQEFKQLEQPGEVVEIKVERSQGDELLEVKVENPPEEVELALIQSGFFAVDAGVKKAFTEKDRLLSQGKAKYSLF